MTALAFHFLYHVQHFPVPSNLIIPYPRLNFTTLQANSWSETLDDISKYKLLSIELEIYID
jgi:hypothetical protein